MSQVSVGVTIAQLLFLVWVSDSARVLEVLEDCSKLNLELQTAKFSLTSCPVF